MADRVKVGCESASTSWHNEEECSSEKHLLSNCGKGNFSMLSPELILKIFKYLPVLVLEKCSMVCKQWHNLSLERTLWKNVEMKNESLHFDKLKTMLSRRPIETLSMIKVYVSIPHDHFNPLIGLGHLELLEVKDDVRYARRFRISNVSETKTGQTGQMQEKHKLEVPENSVEHEKYIRLQHLSFSLLKLDPAEVFVVQKLLSIVPHLRTFILLDEDSSLSLDEDLPFLLDDDSPFSLGLGIFELTLGILEQLLKLKYLEELRLPYMAIESMLIMNRLRKSKGFRRLQVLELNTIHHSMSEEFIECLLESCLNLTEVILNEIPITDTVWCALLNMPHLKKLKLRLRSISLPLKNPSDSERMHELQDLFIKYDTFHESSLETEILVQACPNLVHLHLENCAISANILKCINDMKELKSIVMCEITGISSDQFYFTVKNYSKFEKCNFTLKSS